jgi:outer membrane immunogenic protein
MKNYIIGVVGILVLLAGSAFAADMPLKAPPVSVWNWSGFYVGGNLGGAWGTSDPTSSTVFTTGYLPGAGYFAATSVGAFNAAGTQSVKPDGFTGGVEAGYNWQVGNILVGVEADIDSFQLRGSAASGPVVYPGFGGATFTINSAASADWLFTARPRIGVIMNNWLFYGTGGLAVTTLKANFAFADTFAATESGSISSTKSGYAVGGGIEDRLSGNWSVKAEYLYVDFGSASTVSTNFAQPGLLFPGQPITHSVTLNANSARVGLNYKLN